MKTRFDPILKTAIATTVLLMLTVAFVSGQSRANLKQGAAGAPVTVPVELRIEHAIKHGPAAIVKGSIVKGTLEFGMKQLEATIGSRHVASR